MALIFCVGRNDEARAVAMDTAVDREAPFWFTRSPHAVIERGGAIAYPPGTAEHHRAVVLGQGGFRVRVERARDLVLGHAAGLDMTRRNLQPPAGAEGWPWDTGKDVEPSAVIGTIMPAARIGHPTAGRIALAVDGELRQEAELSDLVGTGPELIPALSTLDRLQPGDAIMTGTPAGVGAGRAGQRLEGEIAGVGRVRLSMRPRES
ncbi:MAG: fumarylacetoacetate hydrolase family protein [Acetobacteraceae bacterium]|nr:fumarylacetoacetate hydrolase family protein [Acetobacteraceae bacterium]